MINFLNVFMSLLFMLVAFNAVIITGAISMAIAERLFKDITRRR
jgi:hypothetical protein